jgi:hypothetical protein
LSLAFVVLLYLFRPRRAQDLFLLGVALALVLGYVLYWTNGEVFGPRYVYEASTMLYVLSAAGIVRVGRWMQAKKGWPWWTLHLLLSLLLLSDLAVYLPRQLRTYHGLYGITAHPREVLERAELNNALVIVREERGWWDYAVAFSMNEPTLDGDVVYASECPAHLEELLADYAGREVYYFDGRALWPLWTGTGGS